MIYYPVVRLRTGVSFCPPYGSGASSPAASATYEKWEGDPMARPD
ncbi:MAG: 50S ribosomal protein L10, partial [Cutibacterium acnes]